MKTPYQTLGIATTASEDEVKRAFRKLAHQHHPDKPTGNEAVFKEITAAYAILGSAEKRRSYDMQMGTHIPRAPQAAGGFGAPVEFSFMHYGGNTFVYTSRAQHDFGKSVQEAMATAANVRAQRPVTQEDVRAAYRKKMGL